MRGGNPSPIDWPRAPAVHAGGRPIAAEVFEALPDVNRGQVETHGLTEASRRLLRTAKAPTSNVRPVIARFDVKFGQIDLSGAAAEFLEIGRLVGSGTGTVDLADAEADPYDLTLHRLTVATVPTDGVIVRANVDADSVEITGPLTKLAILGDNLSGMAEAAPPYHVHIEWHPEHFYLSAESAPLIASLRS
jgi:hypothetical protein